MISAQAIAQTAIPTPSAYSVDLGDGVNKGTQAKVARSPPQERFGRSR
jgi:hypothetical protein